MIIITHWTPYSYTKIFSNMVLNSRFWPISLRNRILYENTLTCLSGAWKGWFNEQRIIKNSWHCPFKSEQAQTSNRKCTALKFARSDSLVVIRKVKNVIIYFYKKRHVVAVERVAIVFLWEKHLKTGKVTVTRIFELQFTVYLLSKFCAFAM